MDVKDIMKLIENSSSGSSNNSLGSIMDLIGGQSGGLNGLMDVFASKGMINLLQSWIGKGNNLPISSEQISKLLGDKKLNSVAQKTGTDSKNASSMISDFLPQLIDKITPDGKVPSDGFEGLNMDMLKGFF